METQVAASMIPQDSALCDTREKTMLRDWEPAFLAALERTGVVCKACEAAGIDRSTEWKERKSNPEHAQRFDDALKAGSLLLEAEAIRRATEGTLRKQFTGRGEPIIDPETGKQYVEREYSDRLLELLLKRNFPNEYRDKPAETHVTSVVNNCIVLTAERQKQIQETRRGLLE